MVRVSDFSGSILVEALIELPGNLQEKRGDLIEQHSGFRILVRGAVEGTDPDGQGDTV